VKISIAVLACAGCAQALHQTPPLETVAAPPRASADQLMADAEAAWGRRSEPGQAAAAEDLYLQAARADPRRADAFGGAIARRPSASGARRTARSGRGWPRAP